MNVQQLVKDELTKILTDAENSQIGKELVQFVKNEIDAAIESAKADLKVFIQNELAKSPTNPPANPQ